MVFLSSHWVHLDDSGVDACGTLAVEEAASCPACARVPRDPAEGWYQIRAGVQPTTPWLVLVCLQREIKNLVGQIMKLCGSYVIKIFRQTFLFLGADNLLTITYCLHTETQPGQNKADFACSWLGREQSIKLCSDFSVGGQGKSWNTRKLFLKSYSCSVKLA